MKLTLSLLILISFTAYGQAIWRVGIVGSATDSFSPQAKAKQFALKQGKYLEEVCQEGNGFGKSWLGYPNCTGGGSIWGQTCTVMGDTTCTQNQAKPIDAAGRTSRVGTGCGSQDSSAYREAKYDAEFRVAPAISVCTENGYEADVQYKGYYCYSVGNLLCPWKCLVGAVVSCLEKDADPVDPDNGSEPVNTDPEFVQSLFL